MRLSDKSVISSEDARTAVLDYAPKIFKGDMTQQAKDYLKRREAHDFDFRVSDEVSSQTRIAEAERAQMADAVEQKALEKLQEVQEAAYQEAFKIGLEEGKTKAFGEYSEHILDQLFQLAEVTKSLQNLKPDLVKYNEAHLMKTLLHMAGKVAMREIEMDQSVIIEVVRQATMQAQAEEEIIVQVSPEDLGFLEFLQGEGQKELEFLKDMKFEANEEVGRGGCVVETNYGIIDAKVEERINKLWETLVTTVPLSKDRAE